MHSATEHLLHLYLLSSSVKCTQKVPIPPYSLSYGRVEMRFVKLSVACQSTIPIAVINPSAIVNGRFYFGEGEIT